MADESKRSTATCHVAEQTLEELRETQARGGRILMVDDEPALGTTVKILFRGEHDVVVVTRARDALDLIAKGERFDLVLTDLMMPEMSGMQLHAEIERIAPSLAPRVVFMTGGAFTASAQRFLEEVPNTRLEKPFDPKALRALVREAMARRSD